jgi:hypothetical protein
MRCGLPHAAALALSSVLSPHRCPPCESNVKQAVVAPPGSGGLARGAPPHPVGELASPGSSIRRLPRNHPASPTKPSGGSSTLRLRAHRSRAGAACATAAAVHQAGRPDLIGLTEAQQACFCDLSALPAAQRQSALQCTMLLAIERAGQRRAVGLWAGGPTLPPSRGSPRTARPDETTCLRLRIGCADQERECAGAWAI